MLTTSFLIESLSFFMTLISPKIPTLITSNMTRSISITSIQPNVKQSSTLKKPTFLAFLKHCSCLPLSTVNKGLYSTVWKDCVCFLKRVCYPCRYSDHRRTGNFLPGGGGGKPFVQKNHASCPNFCERVEKK